MGRRRAKLTGRLRQCPMADGVRGLMLKGLSMPPSWRGGSVRATRNPLPPYPGQGGRTDSKGGTGHSRMAGCNTRIWTGAVSGTLRNTHVARSAALSRWSKRGRKRRGDGRRKRCLAVVPGYRTVGILARGSWVLRHQDPAEHPPVGIPVRTSFRMLYLPPASWLSRCPKSRSSGPESVLRRGHR